MTHNRELLLPVEPETVYPESKFEAALTRLIHSCDFGGAAVIVQKFGLDLAVFVNTANGPRCFFIEAKSNGGQRQGGVGFGNGRGEGPQVELLLCSEDQLVVLDTCVRWAMVDATMSVGADRYALLNCTEARGAAMGGVARGKQNNFRLSALRPRLVSWSAFCSDLTTFLAGESSAV